MPSATRWNATRWRWSIAAARCWAACATPSPTPTSSFLLQAQASKAQVIGLANGSGDTINSIKQAFEFGIMGGKQRVAALFMSIVDVRSAGPEYAQG